MILRLGLNFGAHLLAGMAFGALAACAARSMRNPREDRGSSGELATPGLDIDGTATARNDAGT